MRNIEQTPNEPSWIKYIKARIKKNKNFLGFFSGPTGSGKTYACLSVGLMLDKEFTIDRVVTSLKEALVLINSGKLKSGSVILIEELGVLMSSRDWQSKANKFFNFLLQTFRHKNFILLMNSPSMDFVDSQTRRLFHAEFRTVKIDFDKKVCIVKPYCIQYNGRLRKFYYKYLKVHKKGVQGSMPVQSWSIPKPPDDFIVAYEKKKNEFTTNLNQEIMDELDQSIDKKRGRKELSLQQQQVFDLIKARKRIPDIMVELNIGQSMVYKVFEAIQHKGYAIKPVYTDDNKVDYYEV